MYIICLYNIIWVIFLPFYLFFLLIRLIKKKENHYSFLNRLSINTVERQNGRLIWLHAASVGEVITALTVIGNIKDISGGANFLITTCTLSSAEIVKISKEKNCIHQFLPSDNIIFVKKFLNYWKPNLALFVESEFWPCLINETSKHCKMILLNARLSDKAYNNWKKYNSIFSIITNKFDKILIQSKKDFSKFDKLGIKNITLLDHLKFACGNLKIPKDKLDKLRSVVRETKIFIAASTHIQDELVIFDTLSNLKRKKNLTFHTIIVPRHPNRLEEIIDLCEKANLTYSLYSKSQEPDTEQDLYIVDSLGKLGLFYSISNVAFIGGSFKEGGHNLLEAAHLNNAIIVGPNMANYLDITNEMVENKSIIQIKDAKELEKVLVDLFEHENIVSKMSENALNFVKDKQQILENYVSILKMYL